MVQLNVVQARKLLQDFTFGDLFIEELGWARPAGGQERSWTVGERTFSSRPVAELAGVVALELTADDGKLPERRTCLALHRQVAEVHHEHLLIFVDAKRSESLWTWVKREGEKLHLRDHYYNQGQPGDLFLSKLAGLVVDLSDFERAGGASVVDVAQRLQKALDVRRVTKQFYDDFSKLHTRFLTQITGIESEHDRRWYASVLLNRLMFIYFLQKKQFLDRRNVFYLSRRLEANRVRGADNYFRGFLQPLFFEGFAKPAKHRAAAVRELVGEIPYLDGGLFLEHRIEQENPDLNLPDAAFAEVFELFERYSWSLNDTPGGQDDEINPDVLGYIFEKYINQKEFGAYYTRPEITDYLCRQTIDRLILERANATVRRRPFESLEELLARLDGDLCRTLLQDILPKLRVLDPACGSGAFLVAALRALLDVYAAAIGRIKFLTDRNLRRWLDQTEAQHQSLLYSIKKRIITDNLFGVDLMEEATEITKLRLFLTLVSSAGSVEELEPLPNVDFNILPGNSLIGLLHVTEEEWDRRQRQANLFRRTLPKVLDDKNRLIDQYRGASGYQEHLRELRDQVEEERREALLTLNDILFQEWKDLGIKYEQATWEAAKKRGGKPARRPLTFKDIAAQAPFHWGYEFDRALRDGGFDVILTNPPWEVWKPQAKEFFAEHSNLVTKNKMTIKDFEKEQTKLLRNSEVREAWLEYQSRFPHVSRYFRNSSQYANQISIVNGKRAGTDINLYKLFLERCFRLLRAGGRCGILLPPGIYSDLGAKQLRELLFSESEIGVLFSLSNERFLFEGVHHSFRICLLAFEKGEKTDAFEVAFRINPREAIAAEQLESFFHDRTAHISLSVDLIRKFSPDSFSLPEFKSESDIRIAEKMFSAPLLGKDSTGAWSFSLVREFDMTNDSHLFETKPGPDRLPLFEGKMIHQFESRRAEPKYWIDHDRARQALLGRKEDRGQELEYQDYRLGFRDIARSTDGRTMIMTMLPRRVFCNHTLPTLLVEHAVGLYCCSVFNSFVLDYLVRQRVTTHLTFFILYQIPVPRPSSEDVAFRSLRDLAARLICTSKEFARLWEDVVGTTWSPSVSAVDPQERAALRAEIDGRVAHLYGLTEEEFAHVLSTFPVVSQEVKDDALEAYRRLMPKPGDPEILVLLAAGESDRLEFKSTVRWDVREQRKNPELERVAVRTVAGFLNAGGGTLLLGVADDGTVPGLAADYQTLGKKNRDGYELFLHDLLLRELGGKDLARCLRLTFHDHAGADVCRIQISPSPRAVYLKEGQDEAFYVRTGNSTRRLSTREAVEYVRSHWKS